MVTEAVPEVTLIKKILKLGVNLFEEAMGRKDAVPLGKYLIVSTMAVHKDTILGL